MRPAALFFLCLLALAAALPSCATEKTSSRYLIGEIPLNRAVASMTRTARLYRELDTILIADVTLLDMGLRRAWVDQAAEAGRLGPSEKAALLEKEREENGASAQFLVALYTSEDEWNDLEKEGSRWSLFLEADGGLARPESIRKVKLEELKLRDNLPFETAFRSFYIVSFPREAAGGPPYTLGMSSLLGEVKLRWRSA
ncbi:MAG: hypothetical protein ACNS63_09125 [Candidatus Nitrospinota bacterium M3_3B_026]